MNDHARDRLALAERLLGHRFARPELLREALTHRSASQACARGRAHNKGGRTKGSGSNERLEFVGDRVLGLLMAEWLLERFPDEQEGQLGPRYAHLVSREALAAVATTIGYSEVLSLGLNEAEMGVARLANVLADAVEAALGAMFLDGGLEIARAFLRHAWAGAMEAQILPPKDPKTALQELLARRRATPTYATVSSEGPSHAPRFVISVSGAGMAANGEGGTKRDAERAAATALLGQLR